MSDVDFSQVKGVRIKDGEVNYITDTPPTKIYWKRPLTYPNIGLVYYSQFTTPSGNKIRVYNLPIEAKDRYNMVLPRELPASTEGADGYRTVYYRTPIILLPSKEQEVDMNDYSSSYTWIRSGYNQLGFYYFLSDPSGIASQPSPAYGFVSHSGWVRLYALPSEMIGSWAFGKFVTSDLYQETRYELIEHETDCPNNPSPQPFITSITTVSTSYVYKTIKYGGLPSITTRISPLMRLENIIDNFEYYKTYYEERVGNKYPKSMYPYLVGVYKVEVTPSGWNTIAFGSSIMYFGFKVKR